jgi:hypothetical protein
VASKLPSFVKVKPELIQGMKRVACRNYAIRKARTHKDVGIPTWYLQLMKVFGIRSKIENLRCLESFVRRQQSCSHQGPGALAEAPTF